MFPERGQNEEQNQIEEWYAYHQQKIQQKFKSMNSNGILEIKEKIKKRPTKYETEQNRGLIEKERGKIIQEMREHVSTCYHPHCNKVEEIVLLFGFLNGNDAKKDPVSFIGKGIGSDFTKTSCEPGNQLNKNMMQTHKILKAL